MSSKGVAVIGAGPAGLTAAYSLTKKNQPVDVYETSDHVGGMATSLKLWGQIVDLGPHRFFSKDKRVNELWLEVVGRDYSVIQRKSRILYNHKFFRYPLQPVDALANLGFLEAIRCLLSFGCEKIFPTKQNGSFESWICRKFGRRLFELFFKSYSEKLWGISCSDLDADFAAQRIKKFSLAEAVKSAFSLAQKRIHHTVIDQFAYPLEGTGMVYQRMQKKILEKGGQVYLNSPVRRVVVEKGHIWGIELEDGTKRPYDQVISSMPLTVLVEKLDGTPSPLIESSRQLKFRNTILVYLEVVNADISDDQWIYIQSPDLRTGRITNFRNWVPELFGKNPNTILAMEYWCNDDDLWLKNENEMIGLAKRELLATGLVRSSDLIKNGMMIRIPRCYPVYHLGYKNLLEPIQKYLKTIPGLEVIGRYGSFKYNNQDHSILMGILASENILSNTKHDLWSINSDYETYQEDYLITASGLSRQENR